MKAVVIAVSVSCLMSGRNRRYLSRCSVLSMSFACITPIVLLKHPFNIVPVCHITYLWSSYSAVISLSGVAASLTGLFETKCGPYLRCATDTKTHTYAKRNLSRASTTSRHHMPVHSQQQE